MLNPVTTTLTMHFWSIVTDIGIILSTALILGAIAIRLKMNPIVGYLAAGIFLGGSGSLHLVKAVHEVEAISELGVSLLLFSIGLEFSWQELKKFPASTVRAGILQIILTPLIVFVVTYAAGVDYRLAILLALMLTLSSTATVLRSLMDLTEIDSVHGRYATAILLLQDIAVVPFTIIVSVACSGIKTLHFDPSHLLLIVASIAALILVLYISINKIADPIFSLFSLENNREMGILLAAISSIGSAWIAHHIGLTPAIGAFLAGMLLGSSKFAPQIRADVSPLKVIFLTLFFGSAGMVVDPHWLIANLLPVLAITALVMAFKTIFTIAIFRLCCDTFSVAVASGLCISQIGEFAFVLSSIAYKARVLPTDLYQLMVSVTIVSIFVTPFIVKAAPIAGLKLHRLLFKGHSPVQNSNNIKPIPNLMVVLGFGPAAREVVEKIKDLDFKIIVIDLNKDCVTLAKQMGLEAYIGDIRQIDVLKHYQVQQAKIVLVTVPGHAAAIQAIDNSRRLAPQVKIIARSRYHENVASLIRAGAEIVIDEEVEVGDKLAKAILS